MKKQELLKQIQAALKKKVNERNLKIGTTHQWLNTDRDQVDQKIKIKSPVLGRDIEKTYRSKDYMAKSPAINTQKYKYQKNLKQFSQPYTPQPDPYSKTSYEHMSKPTRDQNIRTSEAQNKSYLSNEISENFSILYQQNIELKNKIDKLERDLNSAIKSGSILEYQSKIYYDEDKQHTNLSKDLKQSSKRTQLQDHNRQISSLKTRVKQQQQNCRNLQSEFIKIASMLEINVQKNQSGCRIWQIIPVLNSSIYKMISEKQKISEKVSKFDINVILKEEQNIELKKEKALLEQGMIELEQINNQLEQKIRMNQDHTQQLKASCLRAQRQLERCRKEIDNLKRQIKFTIDSSKHRKPKLEGAKANEKEKKIQSSISRQWCDAEMQTILEQQQCTEINLSGQSKKMEDILKMKDDRISSYEAYVQELTQKSNNYQKQMHEANLNLKFSCAQIQDLKNQLIAKDQLILNKVQTVQDLMANNEQSNAKIVELINRIDQLESQNKKLHLERVLLQNNLSQAVINYNKMQSDLKAQKMKNSQKDQKVYSYECQFETLQKANQEQMVQLSLLQNKWKEAVENIRIVQLKQLQLQQIFQKLKIENQTYERSIAQLESKMIYYLNSEKELATLKQNEQRHFQTLQLSHSLMAKENNDLKIANEELKKQVLNSKAQARKISQNNINSNELKHYYQKLYQQMRLKFNEAQQQIKDRQQQKQITQQLNQERKNLEQIITKKDLQLKHYFNQNNILTQEYNLLNQNYASIKANFSRLEQEKNEIRNVLQFDYEKVKAEKDSLLKEIGQLNHMSESRKFLTQEMDQKILFLTQQNNSLCRKYQIVCEQLTIKDRNKEQERYFSALKENQYCLLVKKILKSIIDISDLESCSNFEELLEIGSQRVVEKRKIDRNLQSQKKKSSRLHQNGYNNTQQIQKKLYFGTQISSSQEFQMPQGQYDTIIQSRVDKNYNHKKNIEIKVQSPHSFKFNFSPQVLSPNQSKIEGSRKERLITQYISHDRGKGGSEIEYTK